MHPIVRAVSKSPDGLMCGTKGILKCSLKASTRATYSLGNRANFFEGLVEKGIEDGDVCQRKIDGFTYMVITVMPETRYPTLNYVYITRCNAIATVEREKMEESTPSSGAQNGNFEPVAENVKCYKVITTRAMKSQNDGLLDQTIYVLYIPHDAGVRVMDRILIENDNVPYRVDSVDNSMTVLGYSSGGVDMIQLSPDTRAWDLPRSTPGDDW